MVNSRSPRSTKRRSRTSRASSNRQASLDLPEIVSIHDLASDEPPVAPSKFWDFAKLTAGLVISLVIWAALIWYCVMMWKAR